MFAIIADHPMGVANELLQSTNCLLTQSRGRDGCGPHGDGWGIGFHAAGRPRVVRGARPAFDDAAFLAAARSATATAILAHVRQASVGDCSEANTHPFAYGPWLFAHNGTVTAFDRVGPWLERETLPALAAARRGATDSEQVFLWLLSRLIRAGIAADEPCDDPPRLARQVGTAVRTLADHCLTLHPAEPPRLNFLLTDGRTLIASRWNHSLYWRNSPDGSATGSATGTAAGCHIAAASEPIGDMPWQELPNHSVLCVDQRSAAPALKGRALEGRVISILEGG